MRILLLLFFVAPPCLLIGQLSIPRLSQIDVQHYTFQLELNDDNDTISGTALVDVLFLLPQDTLVLDLVAPTSAGGMLVESVSVSGKALAFHHEGEQLSIVLDKRSQQNEERQFALQYKGVPADGLIIARNKYSNRTFFGDNWPNRAHHYLPCVDHPSDKATVSFLITAPNDYQVIGSGVQIEELDLDRSTKMTYWRLDTPIPMKVAVFGVAQFAVSRAG
ncbi:MAG: M1 family peptidase, partial [Phaeodactylibacter sp.]|nr:M1 family peptidase [Phaeodactylibacter sp.]